MGEGRHIFVIFLVTTVGVSFKMGLWRKTLNFFPASYNLLVLPAKALFVDVLSPNSSKGRNFPD